jgi:death-on-curing protein
MTYLTIEQILFLHERRIEETDGSHGVRDLGLLLTAASRPKASFEEQDLYPDLYSKAAALLDSLIRNNPFIDGNKRTCVAAAGLFLLRNGFRLTTSNQDFEGLAMAVAQSKTSVEDITAWLQEYAIP